MTYTQNHPQTGTFRSSLKSRILLCLTITAFTARLTALDGTWLAGSENGDWSDSSKWLSGDIAGGVGSTVTLQTPDGSVAPGPGDILGGFTLNLDSNRTVGNIVLEAGAWSPSKSITIAGPGTLNLQVSSGVPTITGTDPGSTAKFAVEVAEVTGNQNLIFNGAGLTYWNPGVMSLTGDYIWMQGTSVLISRGSVFGDVELYWSGNSGLHVDASAGDFELSNTIGLGVAGSQAAGLTWYAPNSNVVTLSSDIYQTSPSNISNFFYWTGTGQGQQRYMVSGDNSYRGETQIGGGSVLVLAQSNTAFGNGEGSVVLYNQNAGVGLSGGVTIINDLVLNGAGYSGVGFDGVDWSGSLFSQDGENTWAGDVAVGSSANPTIGVAENSVLTVSGVITGAASGGLHKSGEGILLLTGENTFTGGMSVAQGTLQAGHNQALAGGNLSLGGSGTLLLDEGIALALGDFSLIDGANLSFSLGAAFDETMILVDGNQSGDGTFTVNIFDAGGFGEGTYTLMTIAGSVDTPTFVLGEFVSGYSGNLDWSGGTLSLTVVPEMSTITMLGLIAALTLLYRRRCLQHRALS